jgi:hypothetical protein
MTLPTSLPDMFGTPMGVGDYVVLTYKHKLGYYGGSGTGVLALGRIIRMTGKGICARIVTQGPKGWVVEKDKIVSGDNVKTKCMKITMHSLPPDVFEALENMQ